MLRDHRAVELLFAELVVGGGTPQHRRDLADHLTTELVRHSVAEEMYMYPAARKALADGDKVADHEIEEHDVMTPMALKANVRSVLDVPLWTGSGTVGVLGLYSKTPEAFGVDEEGIAYILARHVAVAVATARREENLKVAVDARKLIGQAMGILMERYDLDSDKAFQVLRRYSQDTNTKLHDVARQLIDSRRLPRV